METATLSETMMKMPELAFTGMRQMVMMPVSAARSMMPGGSSSGSSKDPEIVSENRQDQESIDSAITDAMETMLRMPPLSMMNPLAWSRLGGKMMDQMSSMTKQTVTQLKAADMNPEPLFGMSKDAVTTLVRGSRDVVTSAITGESCEDDLDGTAEADSEPAQSEPAQSEPARAEASTEDTAPAPETTGSDSAEAE